MIHTIQGSRGYLRMRQVTEEIKIANKIADEMKLKKELLQTKVNALSGKSLDVDQLEESALRVLDMAHPDDLILIN